MDKTSTHYKRHLLRFGSILIVMGLILTSCGSPKKTESKGDQENQLALNMLKDIEKKNEQIIQLMSGPANVEEGSQSQQSQQGGQSQQGQQSQEPQQSQGSQQSQEPQQSQGSQQSQQPQQSQGSQQSQQPQQSQGSQQSPKPQQSQDPLKNPGAEQGQLVDEQKWLEIDKSIVELHTLFNEYMPSALKMSVDPGLNNGATDSLNLLTKKAQEKNYMDVLWESNNLYKYICSFYALHQDKAAPVKLDLYYARSIMLGGMVADWTATDSALKDLKNAWLAQRTMYSDKQKDAVAKLDFSIGEIEKVIADKNQGLVQIKGKILMKNIAELEKGLEK